MPQPVQGENLHTHPPPGHYRHQPGPAFLLAEEKSRRKYQLLAAMVSEGGKKNKDFSEAANNFCSPTAINIQI